ncbi:MAG TPA: dTDP-glucose 4,6-dehydratase [Candidatus Cybelea sp.]|jgi:dTDP-glucose 4,6-dehydratase|nr:dTDP-glucose 4,6-dehydratase [Candidatus Cybelea sp.]
MRWLVTGGLGFIGSHFIRLVLRERPGVEVVNLDAMTYAGNPANLREVDGDPRYRFVKGDICDGAAVRDAIAGGADAILNFAAESHVDRSILDPERFLRTDALGTLVLLEASRELAVPRYVQVSTDEVYGHVADGESVESDPVRPRSPYAASKAAADLLTLAHHATYGVPVVITRGSNTYGPHQYPEKIVPLFVTNLIDDRPVPVYGDGLQIRDWLYVEDHARAILHALEHGETGSIYNIAVGTGCTNLALTQLLIERCGRSMETHLTHVADRPGHDRRYAVNAAKLRGLGWQPRVPFDEGIAKTIAWYRANESWWRPLKGAHAASVGAGARSADSGAAQQVPEAERSAGRAAKSRGSQKA